MEGKEVNFILEATQTECVGEIIMLIYPSYCRKESFAKFLQIRLKIFWICSLHKLYIRTDTLRTSVRMRVFVYRVS